MKIFKLKQKVIRPASSLSTTERIRRHISHPIQVAAGCMHYKFHAAWSILLPAARLCCAGSREAFREAEGEHSGLLSALEMAQEDEAETPSQLSLCPAASTMYTQRATLWTEKREPKLFLWTTIDGFHHRSKCARQSGS